MFKTCPKCKYVRKESDTGSPGTCPSCGLIFAKYVEATERAADGALQHSATRSHATESDRFFGNAIKLFMLVLVLGVAAFVVQKMRVNQREKGVQIGGKYVGGVQEREFMKLFEADAPLSSLARAGQYTVVEVYLDDCAYCRELEAALVPFREKRKDIGLVRVHFSGRLNFKVEGNDRQEMQKQVDQFNARVKAYDLCGTPHVEVYGPDMQPLGQDRCQRRAGTSYVWDWISRETGIKPRNAVGGVTGL